MERIITEKKITQLLISMYPESEYKAAVVASAIVDVLVMEDLITFGRSKIKPDDSFDK